MRRVPHVYGGTVARSTVAPSTVATPTANRPRRPRLSSNLMEEMVVAEVEHQIRRLPRQIARVTKQSEVVTYALNRLPAYYATTRRGRSLQKQQIQIKLQAQIEKAVQQGIAAVQRDPLRCIDILEEANTPEAEAALQKLKQVLQYDQLSWGNLSAVVSHRLAQMGRGEMGWQQDTAFDWDSHPLHQKS